MEEQIDLKNIIKIFWDKKLVIIAIILIFAVIGAVYTTFFTNPIYTATATAILTSNTGGEGETVGVTTTEVTLNNSLLSTYREIAKSETVVNTVISNLKLNMSTEVLKNQISVTSATNTQVIQISVENADANLAAKIANEISAVFTNRVAEIYDM